MPHLRELVVQGMRIKTLFFGSCVLFTELRRPRHAGMRHK